MGTSAIIMMIIGVVTIWGGLALNIYTSIKHQRKKFH